MVLSATTITLSVTLSDFAPEIVMILCVSLTVTDISVLFDDSWPNSNG